MVLRSTDHGFGEPVQQTSVGCSLELLTQCARHIKGEEKKYNAPSSNKILFKWTRQVFEKYCLTKICKGFNSLPRDVWQILISAKIPTDQTLGQLTLVKEEQLKKKLLPGK